MALRAFQSNPSLGGFGGECRYYNNIINHNSQSSSSSSSTTKKKRRQQQHNHSSSSSSSFTTSGTGGVGSDDDAFAQIVKELVDNAVDACSFSSSSSSKSRSSTTMRRRVRVVLEPAKNPQETNNNTSRRKKSDILRVTVSDNGCGMADISSCVNPFITSKSSSSSNNNNNNNTAGRYGIGLTLCLLHAQRLVPQSYASVTSSTAKCRYWTRARYVVDAGRDAVRCVKMERLEKGGKEGESGTAVSLLVPGGAPATRAWPRLAEYFARFHLSRGLKCSLQVMAPTLSPLPLFVRPRIEVEQQQKKQQQQQQQQQQRDEDEGKRKDKGCDDSSSLRGVTNNKEVIDDVDYCSDVNINAKTEEGRVNNDNHNDQPRKDDKAEDDDDEWNDDFWNDGLMDDDDDYFVVTESNQKKDDDAPKKDDDENDNNKEKDGVGKDTAMTKETANDKSSPSSPTLHQQQHHDNNHGSTNALDSNDDDDQSSDSSSSHTNPTTTTTRPRHDKNLAERQRILRAARAYLHRPSLKLSNVAHSMVSIVRSNRRKKQRKNNGPALEVDIVVYHNDEDDDNPPVEQPLRDDDDYHHPEVESPSSSSSHNNNDDEDQRLAKLMLIRMVNSLPLLDGAEAQACGLVRGLSSKKMWSGFGLDVHPEDSSNNIGGDGGVDRLHIPSYRIEDSVQVAPYFRSGTHNLFQRDDNDDMEEVEGDYDWDEEEDGDCINSGRRRRRRRQMLLPAGLRIGNMLVIAQIHARPSDLPLPTLSKGRLPMNDPSIDAAFQAGLQNCLYSLQKTNPRLLLTTQQLRQTERDTKHVPAVAAAIASILVNSKREGWRRREMDKIMSWREEKKEEEVGDDDEMKPSGNDEIDGKFKKEEEATKTANVLSDIVENSSFNAPEKRRHIHEKTPEDAKMNLNETIEKENNVINMENNDSNHKSNQKSSTTTIVENDTKTIVNVLGPLLEDRLRRLIIDHSRKKGNKRKKKLIPDMKNKRITRSESKKTKNGEMTNNKKSRVSLGNKDNDNVQTTTTTTHHHHHDEDDLRIIPDDDDVVDLEDLCNDDHSLSFDEEVNGDDVDNRSAEIMKKREINDKVVAASPTTEEDIMSSQSSSFDDFDNSILDEPVGENDDKDDGSASKTSSASIASKGDEEKMMDYDDFDDDEWW